MSLAWFVGALLRSSSVLAAISRLGKPSVPGMVTVIPAGRVPAVRSCSSTQVVLCAIEQSFSREIAAQMDSELHFQPTFQLAVRDGFGP